MYLLASSDMHANYSVHLIPSQTLSKQCKVYLGSLPVEYALKILLDRPKARKEVTLNWLCSGSEHMVRVVDVPAAVSKGDIREALHCFGATSVNHY